MPRQELELRKPTQKFSVALQSDAYKKLINDTLGDPKVAIRFVADVSTLVANSTGLQSCDPKTVLSAALTAQSLDLPLSPTLGFSYIIPYKNTKRDADGTEYQVYEATFQAGWRAWVQLAIRTGAYKKIGVKPVHEGEVKGQDEFGDDIVVFDHKYDNKPIVGYYAYFELVTGFKKTLYWTKEQCEKHGKKYSPEYRAKGTGKWKEMFDEMSLKTVLKQLLSKWGITSVQLQTMIQADQAVVRGDGNYDYVENQEEEKEPVTTNVSNSIPDVDEDGVVTKPNKAQFEHAKEQAEKVANGGSGSDADFYALFEDSDKEDN